MPDEPRILELLEEILSSGRDPEEVCIEYPQLLLDVRRRLRRVQSVAARIDDLFPSSAAMERSDRARDRKPSGKLPEIPGYKVQAVLGRGGMGVVYKARDLKLNRTVAIKMLLAGVYASPTERARFLREAEAIARLNHPHVVQLHEMGEYDGHHYFTMELVDGGTLAGKLDGVPWAADEAAELVGTLAWAVNAAHQAGIVHRDLKPANILLTSDETPKISDFGLAHRIDDDTAITMTGAKVGTPSYMAPEQVGGRRSEIEAATDVYALGAILYELLTGRPPFRAETASETERQLIQQDPVPPSRLNARVPRDLETICLKCLQKEPRRRYWTAAALAEDIDRFQHDEPIDARRTGLLERCAKWAHRHPATMVAISAGFLLCLVLVWAGVWLALQRADLAHAIEDDLKDAAVLQQEARWPEAWSALESAENRAREGAALPLLERCNQANRDLNLLIQLDSIRMTRATSGLLIVYRNQANDQYAKAFAGSGLGTFSDAPQAVAARVSSSAVQPELVTALYDWAFCANDPRQRDWVLDVARIADPDPDGWNNRILNPANWDKPGVLDELARTVPVEKKSVPLLLALSERLRVTGVDASSYLLRVQKEHPDDFWVNLILGNALYLRAPAEAREYYRVALAKRPGAPVGYCEVGDTFRLQNKLDEAEYYYRKSIELDPQYARGYSNLGLVFEAQGEYEKAIAAYRKSLELDPKYSWSFFNLGNTYEAQGKSDLALDQFHAAIALQPDESAVLNAIRDVLLRRGEAEQVWSSWHEIIKTNPRSFDPWWGYAELTLFLGKQNEYREARETLLKRFGDATDPMYTEKIGRACLMLPGTPDEIRMAATLTDRAVADSKLVDDQLVPYFMFAKGLAEYRQGQWASAISIMQAYSPEGLGTSPQLVLAMAQFREGQPQAAQKTLATAVADFDWRPSQATSRDVWLTHILRREAEAMILPNLPAFLQGKYQPRDNDERVALLGVCEFNRLYLREAKMLTDALAADPTLADDVHVGLLLQAARAAAQAGMGNGGAANLSETERAQWRAQARDWLSNDLAGLQELVIQDPAGNKSFARATLSHLLSDPDLAGIRDQRLLQGRPAREIEECGQIWKKVRAMLKSVKAEPKSAPT